jgi:hypothetical protein
VLAASWPEAAARARYVLNLYAAFLPPEDTRHRDLVLAILDDFARLAPRCLLELRSSVERSRMELRWFRARCGQALS